jgi:hypothetical protein
MFMIVKRFVWLLVTTVTFALPSELPAQRALHGAIALRRHAPRIDPDSALNARRRTWSAIGAASGSVLGGWATYEFVNGVCDSPGCHATMGAVLGGALAGALIGAVVGLFAAGIPYP